MNLDSLKGLADSLKSSTFLSNGLHKVSNSLSKNESFMDLVHPYLKYILYLIAIIGFLRVNKIFLYDPKMRAWLMVGFEDEHGRTNTKLIAAFTTIMCILLGWFISIHFSPNHTPPEWYFIGLISLISTLYAIKETGKVMTAKYNPTPTQTASSSPSPEISIDYSDALLSEWKSATTDLVYSEWYKQKNSNIG